MSKTKCLKYCPGTFGSRQETQSYILTYSSLTEGIFNTLDCSQGTLTFASAAGFYVQETPNISVSATNTRTYNISHYTFFHVKTTPPSPPKNTHKNNNNNNNKKLFHFKNETIIKIFHRFIFFCFVKVLPILLFDPLTIKYLWQQV